MRPKFIAGNWKMHTTAAEARHLTQAIVDGMDTVSIENRVSVAMRTYVPAVATPGEPQRQEKYLS